MHKEVSILVAFAAFLSLTVGTPVEVTLNPFRVARSLTALPSYELQVHSSEGDRLKTLKVHPADSEVFQTGLKYVEMGEAGARDLSPKHDYLKAVHDKLYSDGTASLLIDNGKVSGILDGEHSIKSSAQEGHTLHPIARGLESMPEHFDDSINPNLNYTPAIGGLSDDPIKVEVWVVLDYDFSKQFDFDQTKILNYLGPFFHGINTRYASVVEWDVQMLIAGITVIKDRSQQPWLESNTLGPGMYDIDFTLDSIGAAVADGKLPKADLVSLITNTEQVSNGEKGVAGMAYVGTVCYSGYLNRLRRKGYMGVSVTEDKNGVYLGVHSVTHELGHNMGAPHDGKDAKTAACPWDDGYVMAYPLTKNHFHFSQCSRDLIGEVIGSQEAACIRNKDVGTPVMEDPNSESLPGTVVTRDEACRKMTKNPQAYAMIDYSKHPSSQCLQLSCYGGSYSVTAPEEGSPCGVGGTCKGGSCVGDTGEVPSLDQQCARNMKGSKIEKWNATGKETADMCRQLSCRYEMSGYVPIDKVSTPADYGTPCGSGGKCQDLACV